jgi:hypothetical protein
MKGAIIGLGSAAVIKSFTDITERAGKLEGLAKGFERNFGDATQSLESLRKAANGTIADFDLMQAANRAALLGVTDDVGKLAELMQTARLRGKEMGLTTTQAFDDIVTGIGRGSPLILDNLGIKIPDALKETMKGMSETEKTQALLNFAIEDGALIAKEYGDTTETSGERIAKLQTKITNLKDKAFLKLAPVLLSVAEVFATLFLDTIPEAINAVSSFISKAIEPLLFIFDQVKTFIAGFTDGEWSAFEIALIGVATVIGIQLIPAIIALATTLSVTLAGAIAGLVTGAIGVGAGAAGTLLGAFGTVAGFLGPAGILAVGVAGLAAAWDNNLFGMKDTARNVANSIRGGVRGIITSIDGAINGWKRLRTEIGGTQKKFKEVFAEIGPGGVKEGFKDIKAFNAKVQARSSGGFVKPVYAANGMFEPRGSDTVPAMLTPGEAVMSRDAVEKFAKGESGNTVVNIDLSGSVVTNDLIDTMMTELERVLNRKNELNFLGLS